MMNILPCPLFLPFPHSRPVRPLSPLNGFTWLSCWIYTHDVMEPQMRESMISIFPRLNLPNVIISCCVHFSANGLTSFFIRTEEKSHCVNVPCFLCLLPHWQILRSVTMVSCCEECHSKCRCLDRTVHGLFLATGGIEGPLYQFKFVFFKSWKIIWNIS